MPTETITAADVKLRLEELLEERALARGGRLAGNSTYMADLDLEIEACRAAFVGLSVTERAVRRKVLHGPLYG